MKTKRHAKILELINQYEIETQEELAQRLIEAGFNVTQATISRDIRELKLSKVAGHHGRAKYAALAAAEQPNTNKYTRVLQDGFVSREMATGPDRDQDCIRNGDGCGCGAGRHGNSGHGRLHCRGRYDFFARSTARAQTYKVMEIIDKVVAGRAE